MFKYNRILSVAFFVAAALFSHAQRFEWNVDFGTIFDNREGDDNYAPAKTVFQTVLAPEIGASLEGGKHRIMGGVVWTQPLASDWEGYKIAPTIYYRYEDSKWRFSFGMFPRTHLLRRQPNLLWSDMNTYNERNIRGALVQYVRSHGFFEAFVDWRGMQSETKREAFNINFTGEWSPRSGLFCLGGHAMMNHFAKTLNPPENQYIVDNIIANPYVGVNLARKTKLDSLSFRAGAVIEFLRYRMLGDWKVPCGFWFDAVGEWRWIGIKNTLYAGDKLFLLYPQFGADLDLGEPFYQSSLFNRTDVYAYILRNRFMNLQASLNFFVAKDSFAFSQKLLLRVYLDRDLFSKSDNNRSKARRICNIY